MSDSSRAHDPSADACVAAIQHLRSVRRDGFIAAAIEYVLELGRSLAGLIGVGLLLVEGPTGRGLGLLVIACALMVIRVRRSLRHPT